MPFLARRLCGLERGGNVAHVIGTLRSLHYDIASAMAPYALRSLQELADTTCILWGSDFPFVRGERLLQLERNEDRARFYGGSEALGLGLEYGDRFLSAVRMVTVEDVRRVAQTYLTAPVVAAVVPEGTGS